MIYIVEDDSTIRELIVYTLISQGLNAKGFELPSQFRASLENETPDLIILDIMLPEESGLSILEKLRKSSSTKDIPVMMLTAKSSEYDKVKGLDGGADDYMTKPFGMMEFLSRIRALLRRVDKEDHAKVYSIENLSVCPAKHIVKVDGREVKLTLKEYELLYLLVENQGIVFNRDQLLSKIWGYDFDGENRTVDVHVRNLRQKMGSAGNLVQTVRGVGYKLGGDTA